MKQKPSDVILPFPIGNLGFSLKDGKLYSIHYLPLGKAHNPQLKKELDPIITELNAYFADPRYRFTLKLQPQGTPFQKSVWKALQAIPCGETRTYQEIAQKLKTSPRAVGNACRTNPFPIFIPCHRVVAKKGLGGFCGTSNGKWLQVKKALLALEKND